MRFVGALLLVVSTILLSRQAGRPFRTRVRALEQWQGFFDHLAPLIGFRQMPLLQAFETACRPYPMVAPAVRRLKEVLGTGQLSFEEGFSQVIGEVAHLWSEDRTILIDLGYVLGKSDKSYQEHHLEALKPEVQRLLKRAREDGIKHARLIETLGAVAGIGLAIIMV